MADFLTKWSTFSPLHCALARNAASSEYGEVSSVSGRCGHDACAPTPDGTGSSCSRPRATWWRARAPGWPLDEVAQRAGVGHRHALPPLPRPGRAAARWCSTPWTDRPTAERAAEERRGRVRGPRRLPARRARAAGLGGDPAGPRPARPRRAGPGGRPGGLGPRHREPGRRRPCRRRPAEGRHVRRRRHDAGPHCTAAARPDARESSTSWPVGTWSCSSAACARAGPP